MRNSGIVACLAATALVLTACGSGGDSGENGVTTLTINVFGDSFSLPDNRALYDEYEKAHKGIKIVENRSDFGTHHQNLQARLTAGSGTADLEVIEVGQVAGFIGQTDKFVNFKDKGVDTAQWTDVHRAAGVHSGRRHAHRAADRHRRPRDVLPHRPVRTGRPADRPGRGVRALVDVGGVRRRRQPVPRRRCRT